MKDAGWKIDVRLHSDATAAIRISRRKGLGKIMHLDCTDVWIQDKICSKKMTTSEALGTDNMADLLNKYVGNKAMGAPLARIHVVRRSRRAACAPAAMAA